MTVVIAAAPFNGGGKAEPAPSRDAPYASLEPVGDAEVNVGDAPARRLRRRAGPSPRSLQQKRAGALQILLSIGYGARGVVYALIGLIALSAALIGGSPEGADGALATLSRHWAGDLVLVAVGLGLAAYVAWRLADGVLDLENEGDDASGYVARAGQLMSGVTHAALVASVVSILAGGGSGGDGTETLVAKVIAQPLGRFMVGAAGATTLSVAGYLFYKTYTAAHEEDIRQTSLTRRLRPVIRFGFAAHGVVLVIIGGLLVYAAIVTDADSAAGLGEALRILEQQTYGRLLLSAAGAGMIGFAVYCGVRAVYGELPGDGAGAKVA